MSGNSRYGDYCRSQGSTRASQRRPRHVEGPVASMTRGATTR
ncbi:hypothetical protein ACFPM0_32050 [Pseudonocardia sulfidoxydans]